MSNYATSKSPYSSLTDLDAVFEPRRSITARSNIGLLNNSADLATLYLDDAQVGSSVGIVNPANTGFLVGGVDISTLFQKLGYAPSNTLYYDISTSASNVSAPAGVIRIAYVIVGGGGGGGGSACNSDYGCGGGGAGGAGSLLGTGILDWTEAWDFIIGAGGSGGTWNYKAAGIAGSPGGTTSIVRSSDTAVLASVNGGAGGAGGNFVSNGPAPRTAVTSSAQGQAGGYGGQSGDRYKTQAREYGQAGSYSTYLGTLTLRGGTTRDSGRTTSVGAGGTAHPYTDSGGGGGGGGSCIGAGGAGGYGGYSKTEHTAGSAGGIGAGGGGGGGQGWSTDSGSRYGRVGGVGGAGRIYIYY